MNGFSLSTITIIFFIIIVKAGVVPGHPLSPFEMGIIPGLITIGLLIGVYFSQNPFVGLISGCSISGSFLALSELYLRLSTHLRGADPHSEVEMFRKVPFHLFQETSWYWLLLLLIVGGGITLGSVLIENVD